MTIEGGEAGMRSGELGERVILLGSVCRLCTPSVNTLRVHFLR